MYSSFEGKSIQCTIFDVSFELLIMKMKVVTKNGIISNIRVVIDQIFLENIISM